MRMFPGVLKVELSAAWAGPASATTLAARASDAVTTRPIRVRSVLLFDGVSRRSIARVSSPNGNRGALHSACEPALPSWFGTVEGYSRGAGPSSKCDLDARRKRSGEAKTPSDADSDGIGIRESRVEPEKESAPGNAERGSGDHIGRIMCPHEHPTNRDE